MEGTPPLTPTRHKSFDTHNSSSTYEELIAALQSPPTTPLSGPLINVASNSVDKNAAVEFSTSDSHLDPHHSLI